jgi:hypothetical protein
MFKRSSDWTEGSRWEEECKHRDVWLLIRRENEYMAADMGLCCIVN